MVKPLFVAPLIVTGALLPAVSLLRRAGKPVEAHYYKGAGHNGIFTSQTQRDDAIRRALAFLQQRLRH